MKKVSTVILTVLATIIIGIILIHTKEEETDITKDQTKVGMILNGTSDDNSWGESHVEGMEKCAGKLNLKVEYRESVPVDESCMDVMETLIQDGCEIIICNSFGYGEWVASMAEKYPEIYFFHATGTGSGDNLITYFGRMYQIRYLSGIVAGLQTDTNEIGYVAAFPIDEVNRGINAFTLGVRKVNPEAVVYVEWSNSWEEEEAAKIATEKLLDNYNIDVIAMHVDTNVPLDIAEERGIWCIGYNYDNSSVYENSFLMAPVWRWEEFYEPRILECLQNKFYGKHYWEDMSSGMLELSPFTDNVKSGIEETVAVERWKLESGIWDVFYGPIKDQSGKIRVNEGESMTDQSMLSEFDWYVEGVKIDE